MTQLTPQQQRILAIIKTVGRQKGATPKQVKAAIETGLVETNLTNPSGGDGTSVGWRQETKSSYPTVNRMDVAGAAGRFFDETAPLRGKYSTAGQLAQAVQRSAFPARYQQRSGEAQALLGAPSGTSGDAAGGSRTVETTRTIPGVDNSALRRSLILQFARQGAARNPLAVSALAQELPGAGDTPARTVTSTKTIPTSGSPASSGGGKGGLATFDGKKVASWIAPLLSYARQHGWKGTVQSGYRSDAEQTQIYKSGVRPAAVPKSLGGAGSNHERTGFLQGAIDVTDAETLDRILRAKHSRLKYAGAKDPVHFSVPRGGSY